MRKYFKPISLAVASALVIFGCNKDFLDRPPLSNLTAGTFYNTDAEVLASTTALYNIVWAGANGQALVAFGDGRGGNFQTNVMDWQQFVQFQVSPTNGEVSNSWSSFFNVVAQSNSAIDNIKTYSKSAVTEEAKNTAIGEARFMRAVAYFYLVNNWGPVPIITNNLLQGADTTLTRNTVNTVWQFVIRDLQFGIKHLPETSTGGRLTKYSAEGMISRVYLTYSGLEEDFDIDKDFGKHDRKQLYLDSAKYYAQDVITKSQYKLLDNYADLFFTANNNNSEQLFGLLWVPLRDPWGVGNGFQSQFAENSTITGGSDGWGGAHGASADYALNLDPNDSVRRKASYMFPGDHYPELDKKDGGWTEAIPSDTTATNIAHFKKYVVGSPADNDGKGQVQATGNNTYMQRLADVYLIYAEAAMGNKDTISTADDALAVQYFNAVRTRAGLAEVTGFSFNTLLHERRYEFAVEGDAWYDIVRLYYRDPQRAMDIINNQERGSYTVKIRPGTKGPGKIRQFEVRVRESHIYTVSKNTMFLPIPDIEASTSPNLRKKPVPYIFND